MAGGKRYAGTKRKGTVMKKCPYCAEVIQDEAIKCKYCKESLDNIPTQESSNSKSIPCKTCDKGQMYEAIRRKHRFWPGVISVFVSFILCFVSSILFNDAERSIPREIYESQAAALYLQEYLSSNPSIGRVENICVWLFIFGILLCILGIFLLLLYKEQVRGWKCNYCNVFMDQEGVK
ncbi:MAG: zinc ribbon domain-containing protein [Sedimentisphaerales bacterium]